MTASSGQMRGGDRSSADEVAEAVIVAAQRDPIERKLLHYAELFASIATTDGIDEALAHRLVTLLGDLSWRQLEMLALVSVPDDDALVIRQPEFPDSETSQGSPNVSGIVADLGDLFTRGLVNGSFGGTITVIRPARLNAKGLGHHVVAFAKLGLINRDELSALRERMLTGAAPQG